MLQVREAFTNVSAILQTLDLAAIHRCLNHGASHVSRNLILVVLKDEEKCRLPPIGIAISTETTLGNGIKTSHYEVSDKYYCMSCYHLFEENEIKWHT